MKFPFSFWGAESFPASLGANLFAWMRSDKGVTIATGVTSWADLTGHGHTLTQPGGAGLEPLYNATDAAYNNQPTLEATASQWMQSAAFVLAQPYTIFLVGQYPASGGFYFGDGTQVEMVGNSGNPLFNAGGTIIDSSSCNVPSAFMIVADGGPASSFLGGNNWLTGGTPGNAGTHNLVQLTIFAGTAGFIPVGTGKCAEMIVIDRLITNEEKTEAASYFSSRYGLTIT